MYRLRGRSGSGATAGAGLRVLYRGEVVSGAMVLALLAAVLALPHFSVADYLFGLVFGSGTAIAAMGVVLLYRASRILNFAQVALGAASAMLFNELVAHLSLATAIEQSCGGCFDPGAAIVLNYWFAVAAGIVAAPLVAGLMYVLVVRRFAGAPPLVPTVLTIALAGLLTYLGDASGPLPALFDLGQRRVTTNQPVVGISLFPPTTFSFHVAGVTFQSGQVLLVGFALLSLGGLLAFLRLTKLGVAIRAVAEDPERAATLGIPDFTVQLTVWLIAGLMAGAAAIFSSMVAGTLSGGQSGPATLTVILGAAILAGLESLPLAFLASVGFASLQQALLGAFGSAGPMDVVIFAAILLALLLRPAARSSRHDPDDVSWAAAREIRPTPRMLRPLEPVRRWRLGLLLLVALVLAGLPWTLPPGATDGLTVYVIFAMVGVSVLLITGWAGQISIGQFGFAACGAFVAAVLAGQHGVPFALAIVIGGGAGALLAVVVGLPALRIRGLYLAVTSLAFAVAVADVLLSPQLGGQLLPGSLSRPQLLGLDGEDEKTFYYFCLVVLGLVVLAVMGVRRSRTGRTVLATRDNQRAAAAFGIGVLRARVEAFAASGFVAAFAGGLFAFQEHGVRIGSYGANVSEQVLLMVVIGGFGSIAGPLLGAAVVAILAVINPVALILGPTLGVVLLLYVAPGGVGQLAFGVRDAFLRRVAERYRIPVPSLMGERWRTVGARLAIAPKELPGGGTVFVEPRYRLPGDPRLRASDVARPSGR